MRARLIFVATGLMTAAVLISAQSPRASRLNSIIALLEQHKPVFGLYAPASPRGGPPRSVEELAKETLAYNKSDFGFRAGTDVAPDRELTTFTAYMSALAKAGALITTPPPRLKQPMIVTSPKIAANPAGAIANISAQLNLGVSGIVFVSVESPEEVRQGLAAMRFVASGGMRPAAAGTAPAFWGMTDAQYRAKADVWPLSPAGELINWTTIDTRAGLARVREIAAVKGIGVLWPGAAALRPLFTTTTADGQREFDLEAWEGAIARLLAACQEFHVPCGFPATAADIERRMKQGFTVFVMNRSDPGFRAIDIGRAAAGR
jgi:4-hydroxy-2-oxoheptanedioate aldolase